MKEINKIYNKNFNFSPFRNTEIQFTKKFSKNDTLFKQYLIKKIIITDEKVFQITQKDIEKIMTFPHKENLDSFLIKFCSKRIIINYRKSKLDSYELSLNIISSYLKHNDNYTIKLSDDFYKIFNSEKNDFKLFNLNTLLSFSNTISRDLFSLIKDTYNESSIEIALEDLKSYLNIDDSYDRFFDFERKILIPSLKEIEEFVSYKIEYSKIKDSLSRNGRVKGVRFDIIQTPDNKREKNLSLLYELIIPFAKNSEILKEFIKNQSVFHSFNYLKNNIEYSLLHSGQNFDSFLIEVIKNDYVNTRFKNKVKNYAEKYILISNINQNFTTLDDFKTRVLKEINDKKIHELSLILKFFKHSLDKIENNFYQNEVLMKSEIYSIFYKELKEINECTFENKKIIIIAEFNDTCSNSNLAIFKK